MNSLFNVTVIILVVMLCISVDNGVRGQESEPIEVKSLAWSPDGSKIAVGAGPNVCNLEGADYSVHVLDAVTLQVIDRLISHHCVVNSLQWSADGTQLLVSSMDGLAEIWDVANRIPLVTSPPYTQPGRILDVWSPDEARVANLSDGTSNVFIWNAKTGDTIAEFDIASNGALSLAWSPDGRRIALGGSQLNVLDATTGQTLLTLSGHSVSVASVAWSPDGSKIAGGGAGDDSTLRIWNSETGTPYQILQGHTSTITQIVWSMDSSTVASASYDGSVRVWDVNTGDQLELFTNAEPIYAIDWSPDGSQLAFGGSGTGDTITVVTVASVVPTPTQSRTLTPTPVPHSFGKIGARVVQRQVGSARGQIKMANDFDAPLQDFAQY